MTRLARARIARRVSQAQLADRTGLSVRTIQRLESGEKTNPPLGFLVNVALALRVDLDDLIEDHWLQWTAFDARRPEPPEDGWWEQAEETFQRRSPHAPRRIRRLPGTE